MSATQLKDEVTWMDICASADVPSNLGVRALVNDQQVAIFRVKESLYAISAMDPFSNAAVLSRGIVGDLLGQVVVASPLYKQHFNLETGVCLEDPAVALQTYPVKEDSGRVWLAI